MLYLLHFRADIDLYAGLIVPLQVPWYSIPLLLLRRLLPIVLLLQTDVLLVEQLALLRVGLAIVVTKLLGAVLRHQDVTKGHRFAQLPDLGCLLHRFTANDRVE